MRPRVIALLVAAAALALAACSSQDGPKPSIAAPTADAPATICPGCLDPAARLLTITGSGFAPIVDDALEATPEIEFPAVWLIGPDDVAHQVPPEGVLCVRGTDGGAILTAQLPQDFVPPVAVGAADVLYDLRVVNGNGRADRVGDAVVAVAPYDAFAILAIEPPFGWTGADTAVTILSDGAFVSTPTAYMVRQDDPEQAQIAFGNVAFVDADTLTAVVPAGAPVGVYDVTVVNPTATGTYGELPGGFTVVAQPVPNVIAVVPERGTSQADTEVSIYGDNFRAPVTVELIDADAAVAVAITGLAPVDEHRIDTVFPTKTQSGDLPAGPYLVRVTDEDEGTYSTYSAFLVTNPAGNLNPFEQAAAMTTGRRLLAGAFGRDVLGNRYVYAVGGDTGDGGEALASVEVSQLSKFGALGVWRPQANGLNEARAAGAAIAVPVYDADVSPFVPIRTYLYVLGGLGADGEPLATVERAGVLDPADAPAELVAEPAAGAGDLEPGTWYYQVAAIAPASDPDNPGGETLPSDEVVVALGADGAVALSWQPVEFGGAPAAGYRVYRTDAPDGASMSGHLIAEVAETSYTDAGDAAGTVPPQFLGATGVFVADDTELGAARLGLRVVVARDETAALFAFALGGMESAAGGAIATVEVAPISAAGDLGAFSAGGTTALAEPRAFFDAVVEDAGNVSGYASDGSRIWIMGGIDATGDTTGSLAESDVAGGGNGAWTVNGKTVQAAAGVMAVIANDKLFCLGGAGDAAGLAFSNITAAGRDAEFDDAGGITGSINSTASTLTAPRALGVAVQGAGFIYFVGGTSDGADALATAERTF